MSWQGGQKSGWEEKKTEEEGGWGPSRSIGPAIGSGGGWWVKGKKKNRAIPVAHPIALGRGAQTNKRNNRKNTAQHKTLHDRQEQNPIPRPAHRNSYNTFPAGRRTGRGLT